MSRIGKVPVEIPQGVKAVFNAGIIAIEGPKGKLQMKPSSRVKVFVEPSQILVKIDNTDEQTRADYGTTRALISSMVHGVTQGWKKSLELNGVGFTAKVQGNTLVLTVGFSHDVNLEIPSGLKCTVVKNIIDMECCDREVLGTFAARARKVQPPEPYLGKGIKYSDEVIRRKAGKTAKK